jgi:hypothetical protein
MKRKVFYRFFLKKKKRAGRGYQVSFLTCPYGTGKFSFGKPSENLLSWKGYPSLQKLRDRLENLPCPFFLKKKKRSKGYQK